MPMASGRPAPGNPNGEYQTYFAARGSVGAPFAAPVAIPELDYASRSTVDAFLTDDGLTLFFSSAPRRRTTGRRTDGGACVRRTCTSRGAGRPVSRSRSRNRWTT